LIINRERRRLASACDYWKKPIAGEMPALQSHQAAE